jgi:hypothetical protein
VAGAAHGPYPGPQVLGRILGDAKIYSNMLLIDELFILGTELCWPTRLGSKGCRVRCLLLCFEALGERAR